MVETASLITAFVAGLLGGVHCLGMCGGIVSALTLGLRLGDAAHPYPPLGLQLGYNTGRIASYVAAGAIAGGLGMVLLEFTPLRDVQWLLLALAGVFMVMMGLYIGGWWRGLARVEQAGAVLWRRIEPLGRRLLPVRSWPQALGIGLVWGWIPCGLVYTMLIWAVASGGPLPGAMLLLAFGIGTLPNLLGMGLLVGRLRPVLQKPATRQLAGGLLLLFGGWTLWQAFPLLNSG
ncbi:MAG: sulfite exporter TauE/SafE family protein [Pseudomonadota bacterium]